MAACCLQMKKVFSANPEATINVECIMNDIDVAGRLSRDVFEEKSASVLERARAPLQKVTTTIVYALHGISCCSACAQLMLDSSVILSCLCVMSVHGKSSSSC